jgi:hypothetical protein
LYCDSFVFEAWTWPFLSFSGLKKVTNGQKRSLNVHKRSWNVQERVGTFETERSSAFERIVESVHVQALKTKKLLYYNITLLFTQSKFGTNQMKDLLYSFWKKRQKFKIFFLIDYEVFSEVSAEQDKQAIAKIYLIIHGNNGRTGKIELNDGTFEMADIDNYEFTAPVIFVSFFKLNARLVFDELNILRLKTNVKGREYSHN